MLIFRQKIVTKTSNKAISKNNTENFTFFKEFECSILRLPTGASHATPEPGVGLAYRPLPVGYRPIEVEQIVEWCRCLF